MRVTAVRASVYLLGQKIPRYLVRASLSRVFKKAIRTHGLLIGNVSRGLLLLPMVYNVCACTRARGYWASKKRWNCARGFIAGRAIARFNCVYVCGFSPSIQPWRNFSCIVNLSMLRSRGEGVAKFTMFFARLSANPRNYICIYLQKYIYTRICVCRAFC